MGRFDIGPAGFVRKQMAPKLLYQFFCFDNSASSNVFLMAYPLFRRTGQMPDIRLTCLVQSQTVLNSFCQFFV